MLKMLLWMCRIKFHCVVWLFGGLLPDVEPFGMVCKVQNRWWVNNYCNFFLMMAVTIAFKLNMICYYFDAFRNSFTVLYWS